MRSTLTYQKFPWTGGLNTAVDSGVIDDNDLVIANNLVFATSGARIKRSGIDYLDTAIPAVVSRSSSGTTRTIVFASSINIAAPLDQILVVGETIDVTLGPATYNCTAGTISAITTTTETNDTIEYTFSGATSVAEADIADTLLTVNRSADYVGVLDFWYYDAGDNTKQQYKVAVSSQPKIFRHDDNGRRKEVTKHASATAFASSITNCDLRAFNEKLFITFSGVGNTPKMWDPNVDDEFRDAPGSPPDAEFMQEHLGRLWMNDKVNRDYAHYSSTFDHTQWQGVGDSGAIPIALGDGDPRGITAFPPPFRGRFIIGKTTKMHQMVGNFPEEWQIAPMSEGGGVESHKSCVAVELNDIIYATQSGWNSLAATDSTGDFDSASISEKVQGNYSEFPQTRLRFMQGAYVPPLNSIAYAVSERGSSSHSAIYLFNIKQRAWYVWPDIDAQSLTLGQDVNGKKRLLLGMSNSRLAIAQGNDYVDFTDTSINYRAKTGTIYPNGDMRGVKGFKKFGVYFRPKGDYSFTVYFKVDDLPAQALVFDQDADGFILGEDFILGESILGSSSVLAPILKDVTGFGRGFTIDITQSGADGQVEIYGYFIEYEQADVADETQAAAISGDEE